MRKLRTTISLIHSSLFPRRAPTSAPRGDSASVNISENDLSAYALIAAELLHHHDKVELTLPEVYPLAGFFVALRMKRAGFTFRIVWRQERLVIVANR